MRQAYTVTLTEPEEEWEVVTDGRDMRAWEAQHEQSYVSTDSSLTKWAQLAYVGATRQGLYVGTWEAFDSRCVGVMPVKAGPTKEAEPTRRAPGGGSSSPSASAPDSRPASSKKKERQS